MAATDHNSIQQIADEATTLQEFYERYLALACSSLNGIGGVAWDYSNNELTPIAQIKGAEDQPIRMNVSQNRHSALLRQAISSPDPMVVRPEEKGENEKGENESELPTILIAKIRRGPTIDLIELFIPGGLAEETNISRLRELAILNQEAENTPSMKSASPSLAPNADSPSVAASAQNLSSATSRLNISASQLDQFSHVLHQSLDPKETARKITNETRRVLDCDRVTVMKINGTHCKSIAVSGQSTVNRKSNTVSLLEKATRKIIAIKQTFWFPSDDQLPPQISKHLNEYLAISATRSMIVYPIFDSVDKDLTHPDQRRQVPKKLIGGIVIEHCKEQWSRDAVSSAIDIVCRHSADAYRNSWQHHNLFAYPLWYWLGKSRVLTTARNLPKTVAAVAGLTILTLAMIFVPSDFRMTCDGTLLPESRRNVFANTSGVVKEVLVDHGEFVEKNQPLVRLENIDLAQQIQSAAGKSAELTAMIRSAKTAMSNNRNREQSQDESIAALEAQLKSAGRELNLLREKERRLTIVSPIQGSVVTYDVRDILKDRPVERVESLMEVADLSGKWQLELNLPDRKIGHVIQAFKKNDGKPLDVEFILAAKPGETLKGKLVEIGKATEMLPEQGQHLKLKVTIEDQRLDIKQLRSGVNAYIDCGECSLGYSWFHPVLEFLQTKVLFPFF